MENEIQPTILVTGFGPFKEHKVNASWEAVKLLEKLFDSWEKSSSVNLIIDEIPVAYNDVAARVKESWEKYKPSVSINIIIVVVIRNSGVKRDLAMIYYGYKACNYSFLVILYYTKTIYEVKARSSKLTRG